MICIKCDDNYERIKKRLAEENRNIKYRYIQGPTGPKGEKGISESIVIEETQTLPPTLLAEVIDNLENSIHHLTFRIPKGDIGEIGPPGKEGKIGPTGPKGEKGISESIVVEETQTLPSTESAEVIDNLENNTHHLTFRIPKGDIGEIGPPGKEGKIGPTGPKGEKGDTGISESIVVEETQTLPSTESAEVIDNLENNTHHLTFCIPKGQNGSAGATASNAVLFVNYQDATVAKSLTIRQKIFIPSSTTLFTIPNTLDINVNTTGIYELTLCGKVSGVNNTNGAKFYLLNTVTGDILNNLAFELKAGNTSDMDFCGTIITEIFAPATFQLKTVIVNDSGTSNINFSNINLIMKRYNT